MKTKHIPFSTHSHKGPREFFGWQWREQWKKQWQKCKIRKMSRRGPRWVPFRRLVLEMLGTPQNPKWAAATITALAQKLARIVKNQWKFFRQTFPFSQWFQLGHNHQTSRETGKQKTNENHIQPVSCWEGRMLKILFWLFLILPGYV